MKENKLHIDKTNLIKALVSSASRMHVDGSVTYSISCLSSIISSALGRFIAVCSIKNSKEKNSEIGGHQNSMNQLVFKISDLDMQKLDR